MIKNNNLNLNKQWFSALSYVKECRKQIYFIILLFFSSSIFGYIFSDKLGFIGNLLKEILSQIEGLNGFELVSFILQNNVGGAFFGMLFGAFFGIFPLINAMGNGVVLGYVSSLVASNGSLLDLWMLLPHGIFELTGIFISLGVGLKFGGFIFFKRNKRIKELKRRFYESMNVFLFIVLPLLIIASIVEGTLIFFRS